MTPPMLIIGDPDDPHVRAVANVLPSNGLVIVDASRLGEVIRILDPLRITLTDLDNKAVDIEPGCVPRGWIRRLAPAGWDHGVTLGSHAAAVLSSRLALLAGIIRYPDSVWLTALDDLFAAENKLVQYRAASRIGIRVPHTTVSNSASVLADTLGDSFVLKPLGPGNFADHEQRQRIVYVRAVRAADLADVDLLEAPFLAQELVDTRNHLRVVTVDQRAWVAELDATGLPVDWREHGPAHDGFTATTSWPEVERAAVRLATTLRVGFSSQDWLIDSDGPAFLDLNPGGQWLFLPDAVVHSITRALAEWLMDRR